MNQGFQTDPAVAMSMSSMTLPVDSGPGGVNFYFGVRGSPKLLARSPHPLPHRPVSNEVWQMPTAMRISPIGDHPVAEKYDDIRSYIRQACNEVNWRAIGCYRMGWNPNHRADPATIWVFLYPSGGTKQQAFGIVRAVTTILQIHKLPDVHVHVAEGQGLSTWESDNDNTLPAHPSLGYSTTPPPGSSLGPRGSPVAGTLGLYVKCGNGEQAWEAALTSHHVARNVQDRIPTVLDPVPWERNKSSHTLYVTSPAAKDHEAHIHDLEKDIAHFQEAYAVAQAKKQKSGLETNSLTWEETQEARIKGLEASLSKIQEDHRAAMGSFATTPNLGNVVASSGLADPTPGKPIMDWALIEIDRTRLANSCGITNVLPTSASSAHQGIMIKVAKAEDYDENWLDLAEMLQGHVGSIVSLPELRNRVHGAANTALFLFGRTSGATVGYLNGIRDDSRVHFVFKDGTVKTIVSSEWPVVDCLDNAAAAARGVPTFSRPGDSGASVRDSNGALVGMLYGGCAIDESSYPISYITPISLILEEVSQVAGEPVRVV